MSTAQTDPGLIRGPTSRAYDMLGGTPLLWRLASLALFFTAWEIAGRTNFNWAFPTFLETMSALWEMLADGAMLAAYGRTLEPLVIGLVISLSIGVGAGVLMGLRRDAEWITLPVFITM